MVCRELTVGWLRRRQELLNCSINSLSCVVFSYHTASPSSFQFLGSETRHRKWHERKKLQSHIVFFSWKLLRPVSLVADIYYAHCTPLSSYKDPHWCISASINYKMIARMLLNTCFTHNFKTLRGRCTKAWASRKVYMFVACTKRKCSMLKEP